MSVSNVFNESVTFSPAQVVELYLLASKREQVGILYQGTGDDFDASSRYFLYGDAGLDESRLAEIDRATVALIDAQVPEICSIKTHLCCLWNGISHAEDKQSALQKLTAGMAATYLGAKAITLVPCPPLCQQP